MAAPRPSLLPVEELIALADRAQDLYWEAIGDNQRSWDDDDDARERRVRSSELIVMAQRALDFVTAAACVTADARLLAYVSIATETVDTDFNLHPLGTHAEAITAILRAGAPVDEVVEELARADEQELRAAVAEGLPLQGDAALALLAELARDASSDVRKAARKRLQTLGEVPWWLGKWRVDPTVGLSVEQAKRLQPVYAELVEVLDNQGGKGDVQRLADLCAQLPDGPCLELLEHVILDENLKYEREPLGRVLVTRAGGLEALERVLDKSRGSSTLRIYASMDVPKYFERMPVAERLAASLALARRALAVRDEGDPGDASDESDKDEVAGEFAALVGEIFPTGADLTPLVDLILERGTGGGRRAVWQLSKPFDRAGAEQPEALIERIIAACGTGFPDAWSEMSGHLREFLEKLPAPWSRRAVEAGSHSGDAKTVPWALEHLTGDLWDSGRDPPRPEMVRQLCEDSHFRPAFVESAELARKACPYLRAQLRQGTLEYPLARATIHAIGTLYGGVMHVPYNEEAWPEPEQRAYQAKNRKEVRGFLGPRKLQGPPTEEEWRGLRTARSGVRFRNYSEQREALIVMPPPPWCPEDRAFFDGFVELHRGGDGNIGHLLILVLSEAGTAEDLPLLDELMSGDHDWESMYRKIRKRVRARAGLPEEAREEEEDDEEGGQEAEGGEQGEWMDEED